MEINLEDHVGLVGMVVKEFVHLKNGEYLEETEEWADGMVGLVRAKNAFKPEKGFQFSTLAVRCIRNEILKCKTYRSRHYWPEYSLDFEIRENTELHDIIPAPETNNHIDSKDLVDKIFQLMDDRTALILRRRVMDGVTLKTVGTELSIVKERVRQIEGQGLEKARRICNRVLCC